MREAAGLDAGNEIKLLGLFGGTQYAYRVGDYVYLPGNTLFYEIKWRGYLLLGPPGQRKRYPGYWPGEPDWGCYYEDEISSINQLPF